MSRFAEEDLKAAFELVENPSHWKDRISAVIGPEDEGVVRFPLREGDKIDRELWPDFIYEEPGVAEGGELGVCRVECETLKAVVVPLGGTAAYSIRKE